jgi:phosphoesterase RecJ-like protein
VGRSGQERLGGSFKINIDHHYSTSLYADINWIDAGAAAVGEMVFDLAERTGLPLSPGIAEHLYRAIVSDTGSFQFSNTTAKALETCARLARLGASPIRVSERLFNTNSPEKVILLGRVLSTLALNEGGNIAIISMFLRNLEALRLKETDTEDIMTAARSIRGVEMVLFFKEMAPDTFRVSCRSKGSANAALVAEHFGGGGHVHASGFTVYGPYERLRREVPAVVEKLIAEQQSARTA